MVLEPDRMLISDVFPCEDGHAQERSLLPQVLGTVEADDLWIADRNFCTTGFLFGIATRGGAFVSRQHAQTLAYVELGDRRKVGPCPTGMVYEETLRLVNEQGKLLDGRRVTIELKKPTRDGETEIRLLTNLPKAGRRPGRSQSCTCGAGRWKKRHELDQALHGEIKTLVGVYVHRHHLRRGCLAPW